jgi:hypothetical protein
MPRKAMDYSKTIIYKIQHEDNEELVYVGHTTNFIKRKNQHKTACSNENGKSFNYKLYTMIRVNGGWDCFKMVMIEEYPCANLLEACKREDECMRQLKATMNSCGAVLDKEKRLEKKRQYRESNKEKLSEQHKQYYEANKEKISEQHKQYCQANKEKLSEYQKQYQEANKEKYLEQKKQYREANKEELYRKQREKYHAKKELKNKIS